MALDDSVGATPFSKLPESDRTIQSAENEGPEEPAICRCCCFDALPWILLLFISLMTFGSYWVYDTPGAIEAKLQRWFGGEDKYSDADNLTLYSVYSWPNTILAFFGGFIIDRVTGVRVGAMVFCGLVFLGQLIFSFGIQFKTYWVCVLGRFVFGLGGESLTVAQNAFTVRWFSGSLRAMAFGLVVAIQRVGSSVNFIATPPMADIGVPFSVWFGTGMCALSVLACVLSWVLDWYGEPRIQRQAKLQAEADGGETVEEEVSLTQIKDFNAGAWLLFFICQLFYIGFLVFNSVASKIMQNTGAKYSENTATYFLSIPNFVSVLTSPIFGRMVDKKGRALTFIMISSIMMVAAHMAFLGNANEWFFIPPPAIFVWLGIAYSLGASCIWPTLSYCVEPKLLGTAYGCMTALQNLGLAVFPLIIGDIQDRLGSPARYTIPLLIFAGCEAGAMILTMVLLGWDKRKNSGILNASAEGRAAILEARETEKLLLGIDGVIPSKEGGGGEAGAEGDAIVYHPPVIRVIPPESAASSSAGGYSAVPSQDQHDSDHLDRPTLTRQRRSSSGGSSVGSYQRKAMLGL